MEMKKFFYCQNNGVLALVPEEVLGEYFQYFRSDSPEGRSPAVFTVVSDERRAEYPTAATMSRSDWEAVLALASKAGVEVVLEEKGLFVPFSNGAEFSTPARREEEMRYQHSVAELVKYLGLL